MTYLKRVATGLCLLLALGLGTAHAEDTAKQEAIVELLKVTKTAELTKKSAVSSLQLFLGQKYKKRPDIPDELKQKTFDIAVETFNENMDGMLVSMAQIYEEIFTLQEIQGLVTFYKTDLGQKVINKMPGIMEKAMVVGAQWGQKIAAIAVERIRKELASDGYDI